MDFLAYGDLGNYKGSNGKVGVIGGCFEYTGAPYYSAVSALRSGSDLAHIFCTKSAAIPIKSYSPELIVHPTLDASDESEISNFEEHSERIKSTSSRWFNSLSVLIVGPGLGRDPFLTSFLVPKLISSIYENSTFYIEKPLILDADGINLIINNSEIINPQHPTILTPNLVEFSRLWEKFIKTPTPKLTVNETSVSWRDANDSEIQPVVQLARTLGVHLLVKGNVDIITDGNKVATVGLLGSQKRVGGQGDVLSGVLGSTVYQAQKNSYELVRALTCASLIVRKSAFLAFSKKQRGLTCPDIIKYLPKALIETLGSYNL